MLFAIRAAYGGKTYLPPHIAAKRRSSLQADVLTDRELEIMELVAQGHAKKLIARKFSVAEGTVKTHVKAILAILAKLDATSRTEAGAIALRRGITCLN